MRHLNIPFVLRSFGSLPTDVRDTVYTYPYYTNECEKRLLEICNLPPELIFGHQILMEMPAILTYLAVREGKEQEFLGSGAEEKAAVAHWLSLLDEKVHGMAVKMMAAPTWFIVGEDGSHQAIWARGHAHLLDFFGKINTSLANAPFAVGGRPTVVDFNLYVFARWYKELWLLGGFETQSPEYYRVMKSVEALNGVAAAVQEQRKMLLFQGVEEEQ
jgi:glutathione S-transferase